MPPKQKFTKEEIITAALEIVRRDGIGAITARRLGAELGSSSRPIFTVFKSMEEVQQEVILAARTLYNGYVQKGLSENLAFKGVGKQYILFAIKEPKLFQLLFMTEQGSPLGLSNVLSVIDDNSEKILESVQVYGLSREKSKELYQYLWLFTHGIAALYAAGVCQFTEGQLDEMMTNVFMGMLYKIKEETEKKIDD